MIVRPNQVWVSDITYISTEEGWLYLAIVKDRYTREIVGYSSSDRIDSELTMNALKNAIHKYRPGKGLIHHSDRGMQYCSKEFQLLLGKHSITPSMSRKGNPYDNAVAENFFSCIKCEMVYLNRFATRQEAMQAVFCYIDGFYNRRRRHEALGRISPSEFRSRWERAHGSVGSKYASRSGGRSQGILRALTSDDGSATQHYQDGTEAPVQRAVVVPEVGLAATEHFPFPYDLTRKRKINRVH